jgi:pre-rRNA-processing protein TSR4
LPLLTLSPFLSTLPPPKYYLQVMPQLLSYLGVDEDDPSAPDWGTIAVYSCAASCGGGGAGGGGDGGDGDGPSAYAEEFVWVQPPATA